MFGLLNSHCILHPASYNRLPIATNTTLHPHSLLPCLRYNCWSISCSVICSSFALHSFRTSRLLRLARTLLRTKGTPHRLGHPLPPTSPLLRTLCLACTTHIHGHSYHAHAHTATSTSPLDTRRKQPPVPTQTQSRLSPIKPTHGPVRPLSRSQHAEPDTSPAPPRLTPLVRRTHDDAAYACR